MKIIYAIPGIGTTKELFQNISIAGYELKVLEWPVPKKEFTLSDYARQFIKQIDTSVPVNLLGVSFGGMLCSELANMIPVQNVILISSCKTSLEFPPLLRFLKTVPLHRLFSENGFKTLSKIGFKKALQPIFVEMIDSMPPGYFSCCIRYIINWNKKEHWPGIVSIHGTADRLLRYNNIKNAQAVTNGSHVMVLYNADEINTILNQQLHDY